MKFVLKPSLEHRALVKIVISLWNQNDVRALISETNFGNLYSNEKWKTIEERVTEKIPQLPLPKLLQENVVGFIKPIGLQILEWIKFHYRHFRHHVSLPADLCWTPQGTVDRKRTAEVLVRDESLDISTRYELACIYCLEDDIIQFWNSMSKYLKESVFFKSPIINFWSRNMMKKRKRPGNAHISYKDVFHQSVKSDNKVAAEYFLQKLTPTERKESLVETAKRVTGTDTLCFLISEMDEEQQREVFKKKPFRVLRCFLRWPLQSFFIGIANCMWEFLSKEDYDDILTKIIVKVNDGYKDWNYQELFREFWQKSPNVKKSFVINEIDKSWLLPSLFRIKDKENIRLILKDANFTVKERLIYSYDIKNFCECSIRDNEWDFLEFFIRECLPTRKAMLRFKEKFENRMHPYFKECSATEKHNWNLLFFFSDDSTCKYGKRSIECDESTSSKQFRNLQVTHA